MTAQFSHAESELGTEKFVNVLRSKVGRLQAGRSYGLLRTG